MFTTTFARLVKRFRIVRAALTQSWHEHQCSCGETWFCMTAICADDVQPIINRRGAVIRPGRYVADICAACEQKSRAVWAQNCLKTFKPARVQ